MRKLKNLLHSTNLVVFTLAIIAGGILLILILPLFIQISIVESYSRIIYNMGLGLGALFGSLGGFNFTKEQLEKNKIEQKIALYRKMYPANELGKKFDIVRSQNNLDWLYIRDNGDTGNPKDSVLHHIGNRYTLRDLDFVNYEVITLTKDFFSKYQIGDPLLTRGEVGE